MTESVPAASGLTILGIALSLFGPGAVAVLADRYFGASQPMVIRSLGLAAFVILVAAVVTIAVRGERLAWSDVGFGRTSWASVGCAVALAGFFVLIFGPLAVAMLTRLGLGSFKTGMAALGALPTWYLIVAITIVAAGEEWLYRGYAIERLTAVTGNIWLAGAISLLAFGVAHLPMWGLGPSLTTFFSGAILSALYIWRRDATLLILAHVATDIYGLVIVRSFPGGN
jgi:membrane protease YdiL (CAAX protease family)